MVHVFRFDGQNVIPRVLEALKLFVTLRVTSILVKELSHNFVRIVKTKLRSTTAPERLGGLLTTFME